MICPETLFDVDTYRCQSKHFNLIAFQVEVGLLLRVLKGAAATNSDKGASTTVVQDVPISKPYTASEVQSLVAAKDVGAFCPAYVDLVPALGAAQAIVDRLKSVDDTAMLAISRGGDAHVLVQTASVALGAQLRDLPLPCPCPSAPPGCLPLLCVRSKSVGDQLQGALDAGKAVSVHIQLKQLSRVLHTTLLTEPAQVLCGTAKGPRILILLVAQMGQCARLTTYFPPDIYCSCTARSSPHTNL
ncbi:hypothetical protein VOLCADRAFT_94140 [Volvox carteri f. nagariensis]|uniref:Checkpoint protein n=1 Tax=Volvox carteri f. nagariensis TaxID=3068 RepID=D8U492_VOLCA|nr:uncharacterized protein VOLCADRAFT_94140 [Volvox carteri f. nagariensis]EFJ45462.1 hypothetical protein VOLCADRAFT_94140 [Volvox carteri f. nagariensis]|eukprot:XP_002953489.1 hypothetical protein VOLCADRAFT_94140 [Volvox carteri f. nagariensis]